MKILLTFPPVDNVHTWEGPALVKRITELFARSKNQRGHELTLVAEEADVILYLEPNCWKDRAYAELLLKEEHIRRFPKKCFAYNYADFFIGFLPGIYVGLPKGHASDPRLGTWSYVLGLPNPWVEKSSGMREIAAPSLLFSFRGTNTAVVRRAIFDRGHDWSEFARITELDGKHFYKLTEDLQRSYIAEMLDSAFVLCPRGLGTSSHRLFETLALGRVPVILSDTWVAPVGPDWSSFSIRVAEAEVASLPERLELLRADAPKMGRLAREAWETWFAPEVVVPRFFDRLEELISAGATAAPDYSKIWRQWRFYAPYGLAPHQKIWKNLTSGKLLHKVKRKLFRAE